MGEVYLQTKVDFFELKSRSNNYQFSFSNTLFFFIFYKVKENPIRPLAKNFPPPVMRKFSILPLLINYLIYKNFISNDNLHEINAFGLLFVIVVSSFSQNCHCITIFFL